MEYGLTIAPTDYAIPPAELAIESEARGFESIWFPEHSHIPTSRESPFPGGGKLPDTYFQMMDPLVALAAAASVTKTLKLATGICLIVQRDPIQTAKAVATLDRVSNGRVIFGVGAGWNVEEMANHGTLDFKRRFKLMRERIEAMIEIWTKDEPEYHGEFVDFDPIWAWPKPVQDPYPPIVVGGEFPGAARRAVRYGDGWLPIGLMPTAIDKLPEFRDMAEKAGRDPDSIQVTLFGALPVPEILARFRDAGVWRVVFPLAPLGREEILPQLDMCAKIRDEVG